MEFSSKLLENAVYEMSQLPGIGKRTALRLVLHLLKQPEERTELLAHALLKLKSEVNFVKTATIFPIPNCAKFAPIPNGMKPSFVWWRTLGM